MPLTQLFIDTVGWRNAWIGLAVIGAGLIIPLALLFIRRQPEDMGLVPDGDNPGAPVSTQHPPAGQNRGTPEVSVDAETSWTLREAVRSSTFWRLAAVFSLVMLAVGTAGLHRIPNFVDRGLDPGLVAVATSLDAAAGGVSTFTIGFLTERIPVRFLGGLAFVSLSAAILLPIVGDEVLLMFLSFVLFGTGIGGMMLLNSFLWADYFGRAHLGSMRGFVMPMTLFFSGAGAPLAGYIRDITGTYDNIWWVSVTMLLAAAIVLVATKPPVRR